MQFCTTCGRPRDEGASFCVGCGNPFPDAPAGAPQDAEQTGPTPAAPGGRDGEPTEPGPHTGPGWGPPAQEPPQVQPFLAPLTQDPPPGDPPLQGPPGDPGFQGPPHDPGFQGLPPGDPGFQGPRPGPTIQEPLAPGAPGWGPGIPDGGAPPRYGLDDLMGGPGGPGGPLTGPGGPGGPGGPLTGPGGETLTGPGGDGGPRRSSPWIALAVLLVIALAGGGVAAAVVLASHHGGKHPQASRSTSPPAPPSSSAPPTPTPTPTTASPSPTNTPGLIREAPGVVGNPQTPAIAAMLYLYFNAINHHNFSGYYSLLDPQEQQLTSQSQFNKGFATTRDSGETLQSLSPGPGGTTMASVTFTSHQNPANSVNGHESCTRWRIALYLHHTGNGYLIGKPPPSYRASFGAC